MSLLGQPRAIRPARDVRQLPLFLESRHEPERDETGIPAPALITESPFDQKPEWLWIASSGCWPPTDRWQLVAHPAFCETNFFLDLRPSHSHWERPGALT
jgi:hypothetical protein